MAALLITCDGAVRTNKAPRMNERINGRRHVRAGETRVPPKITHRHDAREKLDLGRAFGRCDWNRVCNSGGRLSCHNLRFPHHDIAENGFPSLTTTRRVLQRLPDFRLRLRPAVHRFTLLVGFMLEGEGKKILSCPLHCAFCPPCLCRMYPCSSAVTFAPWLFVY